MLLVCVGSDLAMMEALDAYGRPFHQRATEMVIPPLDPAAVADMLDLEPASAIDADLDTPMIAVSRSGSAVADLPVVGPVEIVAAWR